MEENYAGYEKSHSVQRGECVIYDQILPVRDSFDIIQRDLRLEEELLLSILLMAYEG